MAQAVGGSLDAMTAKSLARFFAVAGSCVASAGTFARASPKSAGCQVRPRSVETIRARLPGPANTVANAWSLSVKSSHRGGLFGGIPDQGIRDQLAPKSLLLVRPSNPSSQIAAHSLPTSTPG